MATPEEPKAKPNAMTVSVEETGDTTRSTAADGRVALAEETQEEESYLIPMDGSKPAKEEPAATEVDPNAPATEKVKATKEAPQPPATEKPEDLGEYKADDPATVTKFEAAFFTGEGELNYERFTSEFDGNEGKLNEGTYGFLQDRFGLSKARVDEICAGQVALRTERTSGFLAEAGGKEGWDKMIAWGSTTYTPAQKDALNKALKAGGQEAIDQRDLLIARFGKANPAATAKVEPKVPAGRPRVVPREVTGKAPSAPSAPTGGYASEAEGQAALSEASKLRGVARSAAIKAWQDRDAASAYNRKG